MKTPEVDKCPSCEFDKKYDYAGQYTDRSLDHAIKRAMRVVPSIRVEIAECIDGLSRAETMIAGDAIAALVDAGKSIDRLANCIL